MILGINKSDFFVALDEFNTILGGRKMEIVKKRFIKEDDITNKTTIENKSIQEFIFIDVKSLSADDDFMKFIPHTRILRETKDLIAEAIKTRVEDFYLPKCDPSFTEDGGICFVAGKMPAVGKSYEWWVKTAEEYAPEHNSRIGTKLEYAAFLATLIKQLVEEGNELCKAWELVCYNSEELGHYWNSPNAQKAFELTGSREVFGMCDLANTCKMLKENEETDGFLIAAGSYGNISNYSPIAKLQHASNCKYENHDGVGWIIIS